jgi:hypothetical protein
MQVMQVMQVVQAINLEMTVRLQDRTTARPHDCKTARLQDNVKYILVDDKQTKHSDPILAGT